MPLVTHYQRLNLAESATPEAIENAYQLVVSHLKPTQNTSLQGSDESIRQLALAEQAYAILSDPDRRSEHDAWIHAQRQAPINALAIGKNGATPSLADRTLLDDAHHAPLTKILRKLPVSLLIVLGLVFVASMLESLGVWGEVLAPSNASWASLMPALILCWGLSIMEGRKGATSCPLPPARLSTGSRLRPASCWCRMSDSCLPLPAICCCSITPNGLHCAG
jgi:hypothetical protein